MILWSQPLADVYDRHPTTLILDGKFAHLAALGGFAWLSISGGLDARHLLVLGLIWAGLLAVSAALTWFVARHRIRVVITPAAAIRQQGSIEQTLPFGDSVDYTLTRGPLRRALNLPGVLHLHSQTGVMRSLSLSWPVVATEMPALNAALTTALKGKRP